MRVLLVEGNSRLAAIIGAGLKTEAFRVDTTDSGEDALYLMRDHEFDLVLLNPKLSNIVFRLILAVVPIQTIKERLLQKVDQAFAEGNRARCITIIEQLQNLYTYSESS